MSNSSCNIDAISSKTIYKAKLFDVDEYEIKLKSGKNVTHHVVNRQPTIHVFPITGKKEIYLISQYRYMLQKYTVEAVAGFVDTGESPLQAAKRELKEETGIVASSWEEIGHMEMAGSVTRGQTYMFLARDLELGIPEPEEDEDITVMKIPIKEAVKKVFSGEINISATAAGILMLERLLK